MQNMLALTHCKHNLETMQTGEPTLRAHTFLSSCNRGTPPSSLEVRVPQFHPQTCVCGIEQPPTLPTWLQATPSQG